MRRPAAGDGVLDIWILDDDADRGGGLFASPTVINVKSNTCCSSTSSRSDQSLFFCLGHPFISSWELRSESKQAPFMSLAESHSISTTTSAAAATADSRAFSRQTAIGESLRSVPLKQLSVPQTHVVDGVVYYEVEAFNRKFRCTNGHFFHVSVFVPSPLKPCIIPLFASQRTPVAGNVFKRFEQFSSLYADLSVLAASIADGFAMPPFPSRQPKLLVDHMAREFIEQRRVILDNFLQKLVPFSDLCESQAFLDFVVPEDDDPFVPPPPGPRAPPEPDLEAEVIDEDAFRSSARRADEDYSDVTAVAVPSAQVLRSEHVVYQVNVTNVKRRQSFQQWTVLKRFSDVCALDAALRTALAAQPQVLLELPALPPKYSKYLFDHLDPDFIEHRRILLESYLKRIIAIRAVHKNPTWLEFFGV